MVGATLSTLTKWDYSKAKIGLVAGFEGEYMVTHSFCVSVGALYSMQGTKLDANAPVLGINESVRMNIDYLNIPILANAYITRGLAIKVGVQPAFKLRAKYSETLTVIDQKVSESDKIEGVKGFDFSIPVGLSYEFSDFILDARYNWGLTKIAKDVNSRNSVFMLTLGYRIQF
jgi:hypothetical protein